MPKIIELTVEVDVQRVSCPGVWLCQDGRVSLTVFALGTSYQTCLLPPQFPLIFKDIFYFRKRFPETCAVNNICCLLKDETIFCELVQWCEDCISGECTILAQYLGALNDVLFPPNMCSNDGVDLLMRRSKDFPGILSPKIEIATKVRIDEMWNQGVTQGSHLKSTSCHCSRNEMESARQRQVCHSPQFHRNKCNTNTKRSSSASRSRSGSSRSCCSLKEPDTHVACKCPNPLPSRPRHHSPASRPRSSPRPRTCRNYNVCNVNTAGAPAWLNDQDQTEEVDNDLDMEDDNPSSPRPTPRPRSETRPRPEYEVYNVNTGDVADVAWVNKHKWKEMKEKYDFVLSLSGTNKMIEQTEERLQKILLESRYIEEELNHRMTTLKCRKAYRYHLKPCVCDICRRYHEMFHSVDAEKSTS